MPFQIDMTIATELIALVSGTALLVWSQKEAAAGKFAKWIAYLVILLSILSLLCTGYHAMKFFRECSVMGSHGGMMEEEAPPSSQGSQE